MLATHKGLKKYFKLLWIAGVIFLLGDNLHAQCNQGYYWATWNSFTGNSATGVVSPPSGNINVTMTANYNFDSTPTIFGYGAFNGFGGNAPPNATVPRTTWAAGQGGETTMCFSETVTNPVLLLASLGSPSIIVTLNFSRAYQVVYDGGGMTYPNDLTIVGQEGYAIIVFPGEFDCVTIFSNTPENWTNITWGLSPHLFDVEISGDPSGCDNATITASGGDFYSWSGGENPLEATNTFTQSGTYFVTVTDSDGCTVVTSVDIEIFPEVEVFLFETICDGETYFFNGQPLSEEGNYSITLQNQFSCDSTVYLNLQVLPATFDTIFASICEGESFFFDNLPRTESGEYVQVSSNFFGCDSITTLILEVFPEHFTEASVTICEGDLYLFNDQWLSLPGQYSSNFGSSFGCDSIVQLTLFVTSLDTTEVSASICEGQTYSFGGFDLELAGRYENLFLTSENCDSLVVLQLEVLPNSAHFIEEGICPDHIYIFQGDTLNWPGQYTATLRNSFGCDSVITLNLFPLSDWGVNFSRSICQGETYEFEGRILSEAGFYAEFFIAQNGCDSIIRLDLTVRDTSVVFTEQNLCAGDSLFFNQSWLKDSGTYMLVAQNAQGCDSTTFLELRVHPNETSTMQAQICDGQTFLFHGQVLDRAGTYEHLLQTGQGCDSLVRLNLDVVTALTSELQVSICEGSTYAFGNRTLNLEGTYRDTLSSAGGCDSIVTLQLRLIAPVSGSIQAQFCEGGSYFFIDEWLDNAGTYTKTITAQSGCDSIVTLQLEQRPNVRTESQLQICEGTVYNYHGQMLSASGRYEAMLQTSFGCDSLVVLELEVLNAIINTFQVSICEGENFIFQNRPIDIAGTYRDTLQSSGGCDSILILWLDVLPVRNSESMEQICAGEFFIFGIDTLRVSGEYIRIFSGQNGCDSTHRLQLSIIAPQLRDTAVNICDTIYIWPVNNRLYRSSGRYEERFVSSLGCDSIHVLRLQFLPTYQFEESIFTRRAYTWPVNTATYSSSGTYSSLFQTVDGCDSIHILHLFIKDKVGVYAPNAFTPNRDGINDRFTIYGDEDLLGIKSLQIYDRWGNRLAEYLDLPPNDPSFGWDGNARNKPLDPAVFLFTAHLLLTEDEEIFIQGEVQLLR